VLGPTVPPRSNRREPICFSPHLYRARNLVERFFNKIKQCRRVAMRYDKLAANYLAFIQLASIRLWLRFNEYTPFRINPKIGNQQFAHAAIVRDDECAPVSPLRSAWSMQPRVRLESMPRGTARFAICEIVHKVRNKKTLNVGRANKTKFCSQNAKFAGRTSRKVNLRCALQW
jgi:hypothetical protein